MNASLRFAALCLVGISAACDDKMASKSGHSQPSESVARLSEPAHSRPTLQYVSEAEIRELGSKAYDAFRNVTSEAGLERSDTISIESVTFSHLTATLLSKDKRTSDTTEQVVVDFSLRGRAYDAEVVFNKETGQVLSIRRIHKALR
jgi:hypothetical protein